MLLECIGNTRAHLVSKRAKREWDKSIHLDKVDCTIGMKYVAYGVVHLSEDFIPWFLICDDNDLHYPTPYLSEFFRILDNRIPENWVFATSVSNYNGIAILPQRWAMENAFMEKLVDGNSDSVDFFQN